MFTVLSVGTAQSIAEREKWKMKKSWQIMIVGLALAIVVITGGGFALAGKGGNSARPDVADRVQAGVDWHRTLWEANRSGDYTFEYHPVCFCLRDFVQPVEVKVRNRVVESVTYLESGESPATNGFPDYHTIDGLFDVIQDAIDREAARITVNYDPEIGYPTSVSIDYALNMADEEFAFTATGYES